MELFTICIECKRGKFKKVLYSPKDKTVSPDNQEISVEDTFMQISQFYIDAKKKTAQPKQFEISITGSDLTGNQFQVGRASFDLSPFVNQQNVPIRIPLEKSHFGASSTVSFKLTIEIPANIDDEAVFGRNREEVLTQMSEPGASEQGNNNTPESTTP